MELQTALIAFLAGSVAGILATGFRILHLEMEWHHVRADLRKYYTRMRNDRAVDWTPKAEPREDPTENLMRRYREMMG